VLHLLLLQLLQHGLIEALLLRGGLALGCWHAILSCCDAGAQDAAAASTDSCFCAGANPCCGS
jgi:hypothetical protein